MKKILSLVMVVAMLVAVLALVGCTDKNKDDSSSSSSSTSSTTASTNGSVEDTTASTEGTTASTEGTTASTEDTTVSTEDTTASTEDTTVSTEDTTVSTENTTSSESETTETTETTTESTLPPVFARFDFGTATKAEELGLTSHDYLVENLSYDAAFIEVTYTEDSIIVKALQDHPEITFDNSEEGKGKEVMNGYGVTSYALCFEDLINYDFDDHLTKEKNFMRIRIKNNTTNNIIAIRWHKPGQEYATTLLASCMYLQGGAPTVDDYVNGENRLTCEASDVYKTYTYDINFVAALGRFGANKTNESKSYAHMAYYVGLGGSTGSNNWNWMGVDEVAALEFFVLGAFGGSSASQRYYYTYADTRANIVAGATVEIDYITFGAKADLNSFTSAIEDESISISKSESEAAAATATTAAA